MHSAQGQVTERADPERQLLSQRLEVPEVGGDQERTNPCTHRPDEPVEKSAGGIIELPPTTAQAYTMLGLVGWTMTRPMRPVSRKPMFFQVAPASVDL